MRRIARLALVTLTLVVLPLLLSTSGCGPEVVKEDLGTVVFEVPPVPGTEQPVQLPELGKVGEKGPREGEME